MIRSFFTLAGCLTLFALPPAVPQETQLTWPREIYGEEASLVMYEPQVEKLEGDKLTARAAVAVTPTGEEEPTFGAVWFESRIETDRTARTVKILEVEVTDAKFPEVDQDPAKLKKLSALLTEQVKQADSTLSLDQLVALLDAVERQDEGEQLKDEPPHIIFKTHPALLVLLDGPPQLVDIEGTKVMQVVNSPYLIFFEPDEASWYMTDGSAWLVAPDVLGPWKNEDSPPTSVVMVMSTSGAGLADAKLASGKQPEIVVATEPTELISIDGEPKYTPIASTGLLYVANTESDVFRDIDSQHIFVLLSGRWYWTLDSTQGPWEYVRPDELPAGFAGIPADSEKAGVLASVGGTQASQDAVQETRVPQTAAIDRGATLQLEFDGSPEFAPVEGTTMAYAVNSSYAVIRVLDGGTKYYCCNEAVWFCAPDPNGPWVVCTSVPDVIYTIPASCPVYNVTYVYVYDSTPTVVYVGYYPGYVGCYYQRGVVVYGTGWRYRPWYRHHYYARPCTYGFAVRYNPWTGGWGVRVGYRGHHGGVAVVAGGGWWAGGRRRWGSADISRTVTTPRGTWEIDTSIDRRPGRTDIDRDVDFTPHDNVYARRERRQENRPDRGSTRPSTQPARPAKRPEPRQRTPTSPGQARVRETPRQNNVYADRSGNVHRRTDNGWQSRDRGGGWSEQKAQPRTREVERSHERRQRGTQRTQSYQKRSAGRGRRR